MYQVTFELYHIQYAKIMTYIRTSVADLGFLKGGFQCNITIVASEWHAKHA